LRFFSDIYILYPTCNFEHVNRRSKFSDFLALLEAELPCLQRIKSDFVKIILTHYPSVLGQNRYFITISIKQNRPGVNIDYIHIRY